jgi:LmbE family N-acetylglucosaminyl deacetylase
MLHKYFKLSEETSYIIIKIKGNKKYKGICSLRVYEKDKVGFSVEQWKPPEKYDLMVISCHRDDELLYFGGIIPYYSFIKKKKICTVFMSGNDIIRLREALSSQWSMGIRNYPIFMGFLGGKHFNINKTLNIWGGEVYVVGKIVAKIRQYKPDVIVTHDLKGESGHPSQRTIPLVVRKAILLAANKNKFKSSYNNYGVHIVKKLYLHLYERNQVVMNWNNRSQFLNYKTPFETACVGFDKYYSQHKMFGMTFKRIRKFPNNIYGLIYTKVGIDIQKNDFFENIN